MTKEIWKDIKDYEKYYSISNLGNVYSKRQSKVMKFGDNGAGYKYVGLKRKGQNTNFYIHRLVANAFSPTNKKELEINHKNGVKGDNRLENLEWVTSAENKAHGYKLGLYGIGEKAATPKLTNLDVRGIRALLDSKKFTQCEIARIFSVSQPVISDIKTGRYWSNVN